MGASSSRGCELLRRAHDLLDDLLHVLAVDRRDLEIRFGGLGEEFRVRHGGAVGRAQRLEAVLRHVGRGGHRPAEMGPGGDQLDQQAVVRRLGERLDRRRIEVGRARPGLHDDGDLLVAQPGRLGRLPARPGIVARLDLAALHRQVDLVAARIAGDDLEFGAEKLVHHRGIDVGDGALAGGAGDDLLLAQVVDGLHAGREPHRHGLDHRRHGAEPVEFHGIELHALGADRLRRRKIVAEHADVGAVARRLREQVVRHLDAAGAGHVLRHHGGIAGDVLAEVARDQPRLQVVFAADADADQHVDGLAAVEIGDRLRVGRDAVKRRASAAPASIRPGGIWEDCRFPSSYVAGYRLASNAGQMDCGVKSFGCDTVLGQERLERDLLAGERHDHGAGRHRLPMGALGVERLGDDDDVLAGLAVVERIGVVVGGIAEGVEVAPVGERRGEAQRLLDAVRAAHHVGERGERARGRADRVLVAAGAEDGEEDRFRIGGADARAVELVRDQRLDPAAQPRPVADQPVVHEHPAAAGERVAVRPRDRRAGRGAHMGEIEVRADVAAEVAQVLVGPGRAHLAVEAGLRMLAVPAQPEAVAVGGGGRFERLEALHHQRMGGRGHVLFERDGLPAIGDPAAHGASRIRPRRNDLASADVAAKHRHVRVAK